MNIEAFREGRKTESLIILYVGFFVVSNLAGLSFLSDAAWAPYVNTQSNSEATAGAIWVEGESFRWADGSTEYYTEHDLGTVGDWRLNEGSGSTASDVSGSSNDGSLINDPTWVSGRYGQALDFDGTDDYVEVSDSASLDITEQITMSAWVNPDNCDDRGTVATKNGAYYMQVHSDCTVAVYTYYDNSGSKGSSSYTYSNSQIPTGSWTHIAFVEEADGTRNIYINGELDKTASMESTIWESNDPLRIGAQGSSNRRFDGTIDEVRIYNSALSSKYIKEIANGEGGKLTTSPGHLWIDGGNLHIIDQNNYQRVIRGDDTGNNPSGASPGNIWIEGGNFHYIGTNGNERSVSP